MKLENTEEIFTDCRSEVGITVSAIDGIIAFARLLRNRNLNHMEIWAALADLRNDEDVKFLLKGLDK